MSLSGKPRSKARKVVLPPLPASGQWLWHGKAGRSHIRFEMDDPTPEMWETLLSVLQIMKPGSPTR